MSFIQVVGGIKAELKVEIKSEIQGNDDNVVEIGPKDIINNNNQSDNEDNSNDVNKDNQPLQEDQHLKEIKNVKIEQEAAKGDKLDINSDDGKQPKDKIRHFKLKNNLQLAESLVLNYSVNTDSIDGTNKAKLQEPTQEIDVIPNTNCSKAAKGGKLDIISDNGKQPKDKIRNFKVKNNLQVAESLVSNNSVNTDSIDGTNKAKLQEPTQEIDVIPNTNCSKAAKGGKLEITSENGNQPKDKIRNFKVKNNLQVAESLVSSHSVNTNLIDGNKKTKLQKPTQELTQDINGITSTNWSDIYRTHEGTVIKKDHDKIKKNSVPTSHVAATEYTKEDIDKFRCNHCPFVTTAKKYVSQHIRMKHRDKTKTYECPYCPFKSKYYPRYHIISVHKTESELTWFRCNLCDYKAKLKNALTNHMISHYNPTEMKVMDRMKSCNKCPKIFKNEKSLRRHKLVSHERHNLKQLKCLECEYQTYSSEQLRHHIEMCHSDFKSLETLQCPKCPFKTKFKKKLLSHKSIYHRAGVQCEKCGYQTHSMERMQLHLINHKEVKDDADLKYRCDKCDYKTYRQYSLQVHKLNHLKPEEIQYFYCYHCSFKAKRKDNLKTHVLKHFKRNEVTLCCYICDFTTPKRHLLFNHIDKHSKGINMNCKSDDERSEEPPIERRKRRARGSSPAKQLRKRNVRTKASQSKLNQQQNADSSETEDSSAVGNQ